MLDTIAHLFFPRTSNNHRPRVIQPIGLAFLIAMVLVFNSTVELLMVMKPKGLVLGYASNINVDQVVEQTNSERSKAGLPPLKFNNALTQAAQAKAKDMFAYNYWAHFNPNGTTPWFFIKQSGYGYSVAGENLARDFDNTNSMMAAWMASPTHKANIVHNRYQDIGVAVVNGHLNGVETTLVVQMFGRPAAAPAAVQKQIKPKPQLSSGVIQDETAQAPVQVTTAYAPAINSVLSESQSSNENAVYISPSTIKQAIALAILALIGGVLVIDEIMIRRNKTIRFVGKNFAHFGLIAVGILIVLTLSKPGGIL